MEWFGFFVQLTRQGKDAPAGLTQALSRAVSFSAIDLIVLARGGGSIEDLWAFNEESGPQVAIARSQPFPLLASNGLS